MKLNIKKIKIKNFLSVGSQPVEFEFKKGIYLVTGKIEGQNIRNGCGKSLIFVDSIIFALYGKSMRELNLDQMVNSINKEKCEVTLWLEINNKKYRIERGIKPGYLKLFENEKECKIIGSKSKAQKNLERLLGISFLSFKNIITQNINSSKPFFEMNSSERRVFLEDIVNLSVYGKMFDIIKKDHNEYKNNKKILTNKYESAKYIYKDKLNTYNKITQLKENFEKNKQENIQNLKNEIHELETKKEKIKIPEKDYEKIKEKITSKIYDLTDKKATVKQETKNIKNNLNKNIEELNNIIKNPICPICKTPTDSEHPQIHIKKLNKENNEYENILKEKSEKIEKIETKLIELKNKLEKVKNICKKINKQKDEQKDIDSNIFHTTQKLKQEEIKEFEINDVISKEDIENSKKTALIKKDELNKEATNLVYTQRLKEVFGDKGIKNYIIKKILPVLNKKLNDHLLSFNASYSLLFDEELNETLKSRGCQNFNYKNFSSGEKKRIDLALIFTFIFLAKTRNSVDCNILVLDEVLDTSLCADGTESFITFLKTTFKKTFPDLCIYVITHKPDITEEHFDGKINLIKSNEFTKIKNIN